MSIKNVENVNDDLWRKFVGASQLKGAKTVGDFLNHVIKEYLIREHLIDEEEYPELLEKVEVRYIKNVGREIKKGQVMLLEKEDAMLAIKEGWAEWLRR